MLKEQGPTLEQKAGCTRSMESSNRNCNRAELLTIVIETDTVPANFQLTLVYIEMNMPSRECLPKDLVTLARINQVQWITGKCARHPRVQGRRKMLSAIAQR
jgi:hypothetical protein